MGEELVWNLDDRRQKIKAIALNHWVLLYPRMSVFSFYSIIWPICSCTQVEQIHRLIDIVTEVMRFTRNLLVTLFLDYIMPRGCINTKSFTSIFYEFIIFRLRQNLYI